MSAKSHVIILQRSGENRIAIVKCDCRVETSDEVMDRIVKAVTKWVQETVDGENAWEICSEDFNIAYLEAIVVDSIRNEISDTIFPFLIAEDIYNLEIDLYGSSDCPSNYTYDTVLVEGL